MNNHILSGLFGGLLTTAVALGGGWYASDNNLLTFNTTPSFSELAKQQIPGVVYVSRKSTDANFGIGTGFFIDENLIVTNAHVVGGNIEDVIPKDLKVQILLQSSSKMFDATVIAQDSVSDIALIRIDDWAGFKKYNTVKILKFSNSRDVSVGDPIWAIGNPIGFGWSVTKGILSHPERNLNMQLPTYFLQDDLNLGPGNSGGPLFDIKGNVVGINAIIVSMTGGHLSFSIPSNIIQKVISELLHNAKSAVDWPYIGIIMKAGENGGPVVVDTVKFKESGLLSGDIINSFKTKNMSDFIVSYRGFEIKDAVSELVMGDTVDFRIIRDGKDMAVSVKLSHSYTLTDLLPIIKAQDDAMAEKEKNQGQGQNK